jgi:trk system potassium uptake protein TrkA
MNVLIVGGGIVGISLAEHLLRFDYQINIVEQDKDRCEYISNKLDVGVLHGVGSDPGILKRAGIDSAGIVIAVTPFDETNLLVCNFAMQRNVEKRIARIRSDIFTGDHSGISLEKVGVTHVIEPEREVVKRIIQYVELPGVTESANFQNDMIYLRGCIVTEDMPIAGKTLAQIRGMAHEDPFLIVVIVRDKKSLAPVGNQVILPGDRIVSVMPKTSFSTFRYLINREQEKLKKIIVSGNTIAAVHLSNALKPFCERVILTNSDLEHGRAAASELQGIEVLYGESTDTEFLQELNVRHADFFIAAGEDSEDNIMSCLIAKEEGVKKTVAIRFDQRYGRLFNSMGIDHIVNPQEITLNMIIEKIQKIPIGTYLKLKTADVEISRCIVKKNSPVIGQPLREYEKHFKRKIMIGCIIRREEAFVPSGETVLMENDEVIIFCGKDCMGLAAGLFFMEAKQK